MGTAERLGKDYMHYKRATHPGHPHGHRPRPMGGRHHGGRPHVSLPLGGRHNHRPYISLNL
jgi:hypothetical protein